MFFPRRLIFSLALGVLTLAFVCFALPLAAIKASGTSWNVGGWAIDAATTPPSSWWGASGDSSGEWPIPRAGVYDKWTHPLIDRVDMRRVIFTGGLKDQPFFNHNTPPRWAATISIDFREGFDQVVSTATGWPLRAVKGEHWIRWSPPQNQSFPRIEMGGSGKLISVEPPMERVLSLWPVAETVSGLWEIPHSPIWHGLVADITVFGVLWFVLLSLGDARRILRTRRGLCTRCAYDLKGLSPGSPCPECGHVSAPSPAA
ncbi:MAG: hypothetical protein U0638_15560 [Phycisphaerales bacterium]